MSALTHLTTERQFQTQSHLIAQC